VFCMAAAMRDGMTHDRVRYAGRLGLDITACFGLVTHAEDQTHYALCSHLASA
jgi:hypothetical protein